MLSFRELSEKKTKVTINPKLDQLKEKTGCSKCDSDCTKQKPCECECHKEMSEAKKKDDTYLETDFKKRQKNNEKARKDLMKGPQMKNPHFESTENQAYDSQEEVSEESNQSIAETETLLTFGQFNEARRGPEDPSKAAKREKAEKSYAAVQKRQKVLDKHEKKTGTKLDISKSREGKEHKMRHPGSRQKPKVKGEKETELQQHNRRTTRHNERLMKHGPTKKEAERQKGYDAYEKKHKSKYGNRSVWD